MKRKTVISNFSLPIIAIGMVFTLFLDIFVYQQLEVMEQNQTRELGDTHLAWLSQSIERYVNIADGMVAYVMREQGHPTKMGERAGQYFPMSPELRSIQLAPNGVVNDVYPWGKDRIDLPTVMANQSQWKSEGTTNRNRKTAWTAIVDTENGEKDLVFVRPVYLWHEGNQANFWGCTLTDVSIDRMLEQADLYRLGPIGFRYRLTWKSSDDGKEIEIASNGTLQGEPVRVTRGIDGDIWNLYLQPVNGWGTTWIIVMLTCIGLTTTGLISFYRGRGLHIRRQGEIDPLTGVFNRKGGDRAVATYLQTHPQQKAVVLV